jgi:cyclopropane fatty-acyl-phospholipid synthase-like methyltransferase
METFGSDYDKTLMCWNNALMSQWEEAVRLEPRFAQNSEYWRKVREYYFLSCAGTFRSGSNDLTQTVVSK